MLLFPVIYVFQEIFFQSEYTVALFSQSCYNYRYECFGVAFKAVLIIHNAPRTLRNRVVPLLLRNTQVRVPLRYAEQIHPSATTRYPLGTVARMTKLIFVTG